MAYLLSNICTKSYWNWTTTVEIIVGGWVVSFFETQCRLAPKLIRLSAAITVVDILSPCAKLEVPNMSTLVQSAIFGQTFVKRFALCYRTVGCLSVCLSVMLVYCGQTAVGWIKMKLGMQVELGRGHILLDGDPAPPPPKRHSPQFLAHICCGQMAGWIKIATWYGGRPRPRRLC